MKHQRTRVIHALKARVIHARKAERKPVACGSRRVTKLHRSAPPATARRLTAATPADQRQEPSRGGQHRRTVTSRGPGPHLGVAARRSGHRHRELLGGQDVVRLGNPARIFWQLLGAAQARIGGGYRKRLRRENVVGRLLAGRLARVGRHRAG